MSELPAKPVSASAVREHIYKVFPNDLNAHNTVFGGHIMATIDRLASVVAERHANRVCVTVAMDEMHFMAPARHGDTLVYAASVNRAWNSSMEIGARVIAENSKTCERTHIVSAYLTFVALDENNRPTAVPPLQTETDEERARFDEANLRRANRLRHADELKKLRSGLVEPAE